MRLRPSRSASVLLVGVMLLGGLTGCGDDPRPAHTKEEATSPLRPCPAASSASPVAGGPAASSPTVRLPDLRLACLTGGELVPLAHLGRPMVLNLWASWCAPCRAELPQLEKFSHRAGDGVLVLGVVTGDTRSAAISVADDFGVGFPAVFDPDRRFLTEIGRAALPVTIFADADGRVRHVDSSGALTEARLSELTMTHLGVRVP